MRETFEEAGLLLGRARAGWKMDDARAAVAEGAQFTTLLERIDAAALVPWVRWVTPENLAPALRCALFPRARARGPGAQRVDGREATEGLWIAPEGALRLGGRRDAARAGHRQEHRAALRACHGRCGAGRRRAAAAAVAMPLRLERPGNRAAFISLPGDPRHPQPDNLGGTIRASSWSEGRYRSVKAA
jgi:hypothetical protein